MTVKSGGKQIVMQGLALILAGLLWGFAPPLTPYPRLAVGAHIQFESSGVLFVVLGMLVLTVPYKIGTSAVRMTLISAWLTWLMALSEVANAWWGGNQMLPVAAGQAGATGAQPWQEIVVKVCHIPAALALIVALLLLIVGYAKHGEPAA